jgi:hypothetical protein
VNPAFAVAAAAVFVWLGMVLAISFVEAPLKFRAPGVTLAIGLGIGRLVFRAINGCELVLAAAMLTCLVIRPPAVAVGVAAGVSVVALLVQLLAVRPALARRSDATLAGAEVPRSRAHWFYVGLEIVKVVALVITGVLILAA